MIKQILPSICKSKFKQNFTCNYKKKKIHMKISRRIYEFYPKALVINSMMMTTMMMTTITTTMMTTMMMIVICSSRQFVVNKRRFTSSVLQRTIHTSIESNAIR